MTRWVQTFEWYCMLQHFGFTNKYVQLRPPEWHSGLRHCIAVLAVPLEILDLLQPATTGRPMRRRTIGPVSGGFGWQGYPCLIAH